MVDALYRTAQVRVVAAVAQAGVYVRFHWSLSLLWWVVVGFGRLENPSITFTLFLFSPMGIFSAKPTTLTTKIEMYIKNNVQTILFVWWVWLCTHRKPTATHHTMSGARPRFHAELLG